MTEKIPEDQPTINETLNINEIQTVDDFDNYIGKEVFKPPEWETVGEIVPVSTIDIDVDYIRKNLREIIEGGKTAMEEIMSLAASMESPRAYEVVAILMKATLDANRELMENVKEKKKDVDDSPSTVNNNLFVGSTKDLQKMFYDMQKKKQ